jgi:hypothetical protein
VNRVRSCTRLLSTVSVVNVKIAPAVRRCGAQA